MRGDCSIIDSFERLFFRVFYYPIWDYVIIFLDKVSKIRIIVCAEAPLWRRKSAFRYRMKYHSVRDGFFKGVELEKKEVEPAKKVKEIGRLSVGVYARGVDVEIDDPAGISPAKHLS